jgi:hypothetical protein
MPRVSDQASSDRGGERWPGNDVGGGDAPPRPGGPSRERPGPFGVRVEGPDGRRPEVRQKPPALSGPVLYGGKLVTTA